MNINDMSIRVFCETENGNEMLYFSKAEFDNGVWYESPAHIDKYLSEPMLPVGLPDKNGVQIYENDIIQNPIIKGVVRYIPDYCGFVLCRDKENNYEYTENGLHTPLYLCNIPICEVIGNIHENKLQI